MPRRILKAAVRVIFQAIVALAYVAYKAEGVNALLLVMPAKLIVPTLRRYGATIGANVQIHSPLIIHNASEVRGKHYANLIIGDNSYLGRDVFLDLKDRIILEDHVTISMRCTLLTHTDVGQRPPELLTLTPSAGPVTLGQGAYLGAGAMLLENVFVGQCAVIAAGAVVIGNVPAHGVYGGVPAKPIRSALQVEQSNSL